MSIFKIENQKLKQINEKNIRHERDIQSLTESNLSTVFNLEFVSSEFALHNFRIDTLAYDKNSNSFVILEYKRSKSISMIDQGYSYLSLMLNNKADFILEYNERTKNNLSRGDIDWSQSKVLFLAQHFTPHQQHAIHFKDLPIELWQIKIFDNNTILYNQLLAPETTESIKTITKDKGIKEVNKEVKMFTVNDHFNVGWEDSKELFSDIRNKIFELNSDIKERPTKYYIGYHINNSNIFGLRIRKSKIYVDFTRTQPEDIDDPKSRLKYRENSLKHFRQHVSEFVVKSSDDLDYLSPLLKQAYKRFVSEKEN